MVLQAPMITSGSQYLKQEYLNQNSTSLTIILKMSGH